LNKISLAIAVVLLLASSNVRAAGGAENRFHQNRSGVQRAAPAVRALKKIEKEFAPRDQEIQKLASKRAICNRSWRRKR
jgi:hypothetical protein